MPADAGRPPVVARRDQRLHGRGVRLRQAGRATGGRRVRERTLWVLCLAGGVVGAWLVFFGMRHKTRHQSFWIVQTVATVAWLAVLALVLLG